MKNLVTVCETDCILDKIVNVGVTMDGNVSFNKIMGGNFFFLSYFFF